MFLFNIDLKYAIVVRLTNIESGEQYFTLADSKNKYHFDKIVPGKYILDSYENKSNNNFHSIPLCSLVFNSKIRRLKQALYVGITTYIS